MSLKLKFLFSHEALGKSHLQGAKQDSHSTKNNMSRDKKLTFLNQLQAKNPLALSLILLSQY